MPGLVKHWPSIAKRLKQYKKRIIFLDFDGTLAPISRYPDAVWMTKKTQEVLQILARHPGTKLVVISGRSLPDLKKRVHLSRALLIGNQGLESTESYALSKGAREARKSVARIRMLAIQLQGLFKDWQGVWVENKKYSLSVHYRSLSKERRPLLKTVLQFYNRAHSCGHFLWKGGKCVWEMRPYSHEGKSETVKHLLRRFPDFFPVTLGDDEADEEVFSVVRSKGLAVRVGRKRSTCANYTLGSVSDVRWFLEALTWT